MEKLHGKNLGNPRSIKSWKIHWKKRNKDVETKDETIWYLLGGWPKKTVIFLLTYHI